MKKIEEIGLKIKNLAGKFRKIPIKSYPDRNIFSNEIDVGRRDFLKKGITGLGIGAGAALLSKIPSVNARLFTNGISETGKTEALAIDSSGSVTNANQPAFLAQADGTQTNFNRDANNQIQFATEIYDQGSDFASNTFTAPVTGKYQLNLCIVVGQADTGSPYYIIKIVTSNRTYQSWFDPNFSGDVNYLPMVFIVTADMDASDTAYGVIYQGAGTDNQADVVSYSYFSGCLLC